MSFETVVQTAIFTALNGNISAGVYDDVPYLPDGMPSSSFPYVVVGDDSSVMWDTDDTQGQEVTAELHIWSRYPGMKECKQIMGEIYNILHRATLSISGYNVIDCLNEFSEAMVDPDGETRHGVMRFRLTLQEAE